MTISQKKKYIQSLIDKWQKKLLLQSWSISFNLSNSPHSTQKWTASNESNYEYSTSFITIYPAFWLGSKKAMDHIIAHELCHCICDEMNTLLWRLQDGDHITNKNRISANEKCVEHFAKVLTGYK